MAMKKPPHPGLSVRLDCIEPLGLTVVEAAKRLGVVGCAEGPADLSTNPAYMEGFGERGK